MAIKSVRNRNFRHIAPPMPPSPKMSASIVIPKRISTRAQVAKTVSTLSSDQTDNLLVKMSDTDHARALSSTFFNTASCSTVPSGVRSPIQENSSSVSNNPHAISANYPYQQQSEASASGTVNSSDNTLDKSVAKLVIPPDPQLSPVHDPWHTVTSLATQALIDGTHQVTVEAKANSRALNGKNEQERAAGWILALDAVVDVTGDKTIETSANSADSPAKTLFFNPPRKLKDGRVGYLFGDTEPPKFPEKGGNSSSTSSNPLDSSKSPGNFTPRSDGLSKRYIYDDHDQFGYLEFMTAVHQGGRNDEIRAYQQLKKIAPDMDNVLPEINFVRTAPLIDGKPAGEGYWVKNLNIKKEFKPGDVNINLAPNPRRQFQQNITYISDIINVINQFSDPQQRNRMHDDLKIIHSRFNSISKILSEISLAITTDGRVMLFDYGPAGNSLNSAEKRGGGTYYQNAAKNIATLIEAITSIP